MALVNAHAHGVPLKIIAPGEPYENTKLFAGLVVPRNSPVRSVRDLNALAVMSFLDQNGGDGASVKFVEVSVNASVRRCRRESWTRRPCSVRRSMPPCGRTRSG